MGPVILGIGRSVCHTEPRADGGLEGYNVHEAYRHERILNRSGKGHYYRVFPNYGAHPTYYETCGPVEFARYFRVEMEHSSGTADE